LARAKGSLEPDPSSVEVAFQSIQRTAVQVAKRWLAGGDLMPAEVEARRNYQNDCRSSEHGHSSQSHRRFLLWKQVRKDACQGLRKNECGQNHDRGKPKYRDASLGCDRWQVPLDRYNCVNPTPSSAIDSPISQGRSGSRRTPRPAAPAAAAMPSGRQHARVESALTTAAAGAIFSECFIFPCTPYAQGGRQSDRRPNHVKWRNAVSFPAVKYVRHESP